MEVQSLYALIACVFWGYSSSSAGAGAAVPSPSTKFYPRENDVHPTEAVIQPRTTPVVVETKAGFIRGSVVDSGNGAITSRFLGIPYALPPTGARRFRDPEKHPGYAMGQTWNATYYRPACPQDTSSWKSTLHPDVFKDRVALDRTSEDCLYLDLYIPRNLTGVEHINTLSLPVMIYIHGGDFQQGSAMWRGGHRLASHGDVIVAGINFRLGVLGFLSMLADDAPGNFGLMDQRLGIHWIWDNIREFGGDPEQITIFGESSGAISVGYHVISPLSRGLFVRAISQSGTMLDPSVLDPTPQEKVVLLSQSLDCPTLSYRKMLKCLRKVPIDKLLSSANTLTRQWLPVVDGNFITKDPLQLLLAGEMNHVDYILGVASHEGYRSGRALPPEYDIDAGLSSAELDELLSFYTREYYAKNYPQVRKAFELEYHFCWGNSSRNSETLVQFAGDLQYNAPADRVARLLSRRTGRFIYFYEFSHRSSYLEEERPDYVLASHADDVDYVFGAVRDVIRGATLPERRLSHALMSAWTNFARTGDPNPLLQDGGVKWGRYSEDERRFLRVSTTLDARSSRAHFRAQQMALWNDYLPLLLQNQPCARDRNHCEKQTAPLQEKRAQATTALWVLLAICLFLCVVILLLLLKIYVPPRVWAKYRFQKRKQGTEAETKKLHPLPYVEEHT